MIAPILRTTARAARSARDQTPMPIRSLRSFQTSTMTRARKDAQDRESIDRSSIEYSRSGTDNNMAQNEEASFDPKTTRPEQELEKAGEGNEGKGKSNPLEYSPANPDMSPTGEAAEGGPRTSHAPESKRQSGGGDGPKSKKVD